MKVLLIGLFSFMSFANIALFIFWLSLVHIEVSGNDQKQYIYNNISADLTILEVILAVIFCSGLLASVFGYFAIKEQAFTMSAKQMDLYLKEKAPLLIKQLAVPGEQNKPI